MTMMLFHANVVSELMRPSPNPVVGAWAAAYPLEELFFSAVGEAELRYGAAILPAGRWRETLVLDIERMLRHAFDDRVLPFEREAARVYAELTAVRRAMGPPFAPTDCQIAVIACARDLGVATRNVRDFGGMGIEVVDPWTTA